MKKYLYYPGCSLKASGKPYEESLLAVFRKLGLKWEEVPQWNCCGATAYMGIDQLNAFALAARNLALAEACGGGKPVHVIAPCAACYLVLFKTQRMARENAAVRETLAAALRECGLDWQDTAVVRHPLDVLRNDIGLEALEAACSKPLTGLKVACYYGCQIVRPYATFDDQRDPQVMDELLREAGAETVDWPLKARCCGGSLTGTIKEAGLRLSYIILKEARRRGADVIATACPLCQFNLECYQDKMSHFGDEYRLPVAYFPQLLGRAMGIADTSLAFQRLLVPLPPCRPARAPA